MRKSERWADTGRHKDRDSGGEAENKGDGWNKTGQNGKETEKKQERQRKRERRGERERQRGPYQCIAGGIRCNWGVCVCMCVRACVCMCVCVIEVTLVKFKTGKSSRQMDTEKKRERQPCIYGSGWLEHPGPWRRKSLVHLLTYRWNIEPEDGWHVCDELKLKVDVDIFPP